MKTQPIRCSTPLFCSFILFSVLVALLSCPAFGQANRASKGDAPVLYVEDLTKRLVALNAQYQQADAAEKPELLEALLAIAEDRNQHLADLIKNYPGAVMRAALPTQVHDRLPESVRVLVESHVEKKGKLEVFCVAPELPLKYFLKTDGKHIALHFNGNPPNFMSDDKVQVKGVFLSKKARSIAGETNGTMAVDSNEENVMFLSTGDDANTAVASAPTQSTVLPDTFGEQRTAVILIQYENDDEMPPWTVKEVRDLVFGEVSDFFMENSYGQTWLSGDIYGWMRVPVVNTGNCEMAEGREAAETMLTDSGVDIFAYRRLVYVFASPSCAGIAGFGSVGGNPSKMSINSWFQTNVLVHEMGHNFGLRHSHSLDCDNATLADDCKHWEYGDSMCSMGDPQYAYHFNAVQKEFLGWLNYDVSPSIIEVTRDGTYTVGAYEAQNGIPKALKIPKSIDPNTGKKTWYFIEYRQPIGFDTPLEDLSFRTFRGDITHGVEVHLGETDNTQSSYLLHMKPLSLFREIYGYIDWTDPALSIGQTYTDEKAGVTIEAISADGIEAVVQVSFQAPTCAPKNPGVTFTSTDSNTSVPGGTVMYPITLTNHDSPGCAPSEFQIQTAVPTGWSASLVNRQPMLTPGESKSIMLEITSSSTAVEGSYPISISVENVGNPIYQSTVTENYIIPEINHPPIAKDDVGATSPEASIILDVLGNDVDPDGDKLMVMEVTQGAMGVVTINADSSVTYTPGPTAKRSDNFSYSISDGNNRASANVTVKFQKSSGGGPGRK